MSDQKHTLPALHAPSAASRGIGWLRRITPWVAGVTSRRGCQAELIARSGVGDGPFGLGRRALRWWDQAERRAVADHERWVCQTLQRLAFPQTKVLAAADAEGRSRPAARAGIVSLTVPGWEVLLAGVAPVPRSALADAAGRGRLRLDSAGRYGRFWWIQAAEDSPGHGEKVVLLGSHLHLSPGSAGHGWTLDPDSGTEIAAAPRSAQAAELCLSR
jgi:hypothetical protein